MPLYSKGIIPADILPAKGTRESGQQTMPPPAATEVSI